MLKGDQSPLKAHREQTTGCLRTRLCRKHNHAPNGGLNRRVTLCRMAYVLLVSFATLGGLNRSSHSLPKTAYTFVSRFGLRVPLALVPSPLARLGGLKWTRTTDLTLIRRAL